VRRRAPLLAAVFLALVAPDAAAQGSVFGIRGLGWPGRAVTARTAGTAGAFGAFDHQMGLNPAAQGRVRLLQGWATAAPTARRYTAASGDAAQQTTRFPLVGFATTLPRGLTIGVRFSDYLDRSWQVERRDSMVVQGEMEGFRDATRSLGGVTDAALTLGRPIGRRVLVGVAAHRLLGSTRLTTQRTFDDPNYLEIAEVGITDFGAWGVSAGVLAALGRVEVGASARFNGRLRSENTSGTEATTALPAEYAAGARILVVPGVLAATTVEYRTWGRSAADLLAAGEEPGHDVWSAAGGFEVQSVTLGPVRVPLRGGYRWRQAPFTSVGVRIEERAWSVGIGLTFARERGTVDLAHERGSRSGATTMERFATTFVGFTVRP
jgi:hypothetical protein